MGAREEVARLLAEHMPRGRSRPIRLKSGAQGSEFLGYSCLRCGWDGDVKTGPEVHLADVLMAEDWIDDRPVPCGSEAYIPSDYYRTENYGWVRCGGYLGEGHVHEDSNTGYQWDDEGNPLR